MQSLGFTGEVRGTPEQPGMRELPERQRARAAALPARAPTAGGVPGGRGVRPAETSRGASADAARLASSSRSRCAPPRAGTRRRRATSVLTILLAHLLADRATRAAARLATRAARGERRARTTRTGPP